MPYITTKEIFIESARENFALFHTWRFAGMTNFQSPDMYQIREIWDWNFSCLRLRQSFFSWGKVKFKKLIATAWNCLTQRKTCLRDYRSSLRKWFLDYLQADFDALQEFVTGLNMNLTKGTKKVIFLYIWNIDQVQVRRMKFSNTKLYHFVWGKRWRNH